MARRTAEIQGMVTERSSSCLGCIATVFFIVTLWIADAFLLTQYWNWFAVPLGAPAATAWHGAGILVLRMAYNSCFKDFENIRNWFVRHENEENSSEASCRVGKPDFSVIRGTFLLSAAWRLVGFLAALFIHTRLTG